MQIRLDKIGDEPHRWSESQTIPIASLESEQLVALGEVSWGGAVTPLSSGYLFTARLEYQQELSCPRCLKSSWMPVRADVELMLVTAAEEPITGELELEEEDLDVVYLDGEVFDTGPVLLEQIQLNIPMRHLCRPDCAGLCPACGADRNETTCNCNTEDHDPRWGALAELRDKLGE